MKKSLLLGIAGMAAVAGTANVRAACIPTQDCAELGYKYTSSECAGDRIACPFDTSKFFCFEPCSYTITAADCSKQCKNVGTKACTRNGTVYYESCGASKCSSGQTCSNGTCQSNMSGQYFYCCDDGGGYGCSHYTGCKKYTSFGDCSNVVASKKMQGCFPVFQHCSANNYTYYYSAIFRCQ